jgi:hypothetical protein
MDTFLSQHQDVVTGTLSTFDRIIFKGHLLEFFPKGAFARFLAQQNVLLKDFGGYVKTKSDELKGHLEALASQANRPLIYLEKPATARKGTSKEEQARAIAVRDGLTEGLICIFSAVEPCRAFGVRANRSTHKLEIRHEFRKCLHYYLYYLDPEFGFMHLRLQSWFPFEIQVYLNGREWLAHQLDQHGIAYQRYDNKLTQIGDLTVAQALTEQFAHRKWPRLLDAWAKRVNPHLPLLQQAGCPGYYWVVDQAEYATDVFFRDRTSLEALVPALLTLSSTAFSAEDVLRFLGRKPHGNFKGEVFTDLKRRPEGWRVKHTMKRNSIKWYDPANILRVETTINNPREFRILQGSDTPPGQPRRWLPMGKGVANFWRYAQVGYQANSRYLQALAHAQPVGKAMAELDRLCQPQTKNGKRYARFQPVSNEDCRLFAAVLRGEHTLNGFRNKDLVAQLYDTPAPSTQESRQRSARSTRLIAKLRGHGLIAKVKDSRLYRVTQRGYQLMSAALHCHHKEFPAAVFPPALA